LICFFISFSCCKKYFFHANVTEPL
jgi:hypothetical protein